MDETYSVGIRRAIIGLTLFLSFSGVSSVVQADVYEPVQIGLSFEEMDPLSENWDSNLLEEAALEEVEASVNKPYVAAGQWKRAANYNLRKIRNARFGDGVKIGIFDSRVNCDHASLKTDRYRSCRNVSVSGGTWSTEDAYAHGSHVAGNAAGKNGFGIASRADIWGYNVFDDDGWYLSSSGWATLIVHAKQNGVKVFNWSFGNGTPFGGTQSAVRYVADAAIVVKAAGNDGATYQTYIDSAVRSGTLSQYYKNMLWVGALDSTGRRLASYSDKPGNGCWKGSSDTRCNRSNQYKYYWIVAPGTTRSADWDGASGTDDGSGTSYAAPLVSGTAAALKSKWRSLTPTQIRAILLATATDMGRRGADPIYGRGRLNIKKAFSPVRGRVGGVRVRRAGIYSRSSALSGFDKSMTIIDKFDRDFNAVASTQRASRDSNVIPVGTNVAIAVSMTDVSETSASKFTDSTSDPETPNYDVSLDAVKLAGFSYIRDVSPNSRKLQFAKASNTTDDSGDVVNVARPSLAILNSGKDYFGYDFGGVSAFVFSRTTPNSAEPVQIGFEEERSFEASVKRTVGMSGSFDISDTTSLVGQAALIEEKGFQSLSSAKDFGFENENTTLFSYLGLKKELGAFDAELGMEHYRSLDSYSGDNISWSGLNTSQAFLDLNFRSDRHTVGLVAKSRAVVGGNFSSNIRGFEDKSNWFSDEPGVGVSYQYSLSDDENVKLMAITEGQSEVAVGYSLKF